MKTIGMQVLEALVKEHGAEKAAAMVREFISLPSTFRGDKAFQKELTEALEIIA